MREIPLPPSHLTYSDEFEAVLAAKDFHYTVEQFEQLPADRQALLIAAWRVERRMNSVLEHDYAQRMERKRQGK